MPESALSSARKEVRTRLGKAFESKASDALVFSIARPFELASSTPRAQPILFALPLKASPEGGGRAALRTNALEPPAWSGPATAIVELAPPEQWATEVEAAGRQRRRELSPELQQLSSAAGASDSSVLRRLRASRLREAFYRAAAPLRESLGRVAATREYDPPGTARPITELCWLNSSLRTAANLSALADVADDPKVERFGLPRMLKPEAATRPEDLLRAAAYRKREHLTGREVVVAVLDTEIAYKHAAFGGRITLKENYTRESWGHPGSHGTEVAGLIAANHRSFKGVAPEAEIYNYKVLASDRPNNADDFGGIRALQQALEDGADIANCSWGIGPAENGRSRAAR
ncbi:MAG: S8 family serine peptidase, partial [Acidobacteria bacterium]|nr:S8 family serine peptidase [Acidobacteriota bacterium]